MCRKRPPKAAPGARAREASAAFPKPHPFPRLLWQRPLVFSISALQPGVYGSAKRIHVIFPGTIAAADRRLGRLVPQHQPARGVDGAAALFGRLSKCQVEAFMFGFAA